MSMNSWIGDGAELQRVVEDRELQLSQKLRLLREWEIDARLLLVAEDESMVGGESADLSEVRAAVRRLCAEEQGGSGDVPGRDSVARQADVTPVRAWHQRLLTQST